MNPTTIRRSASTYARLRKTGRPSGEAPTRARAYGLALSTLMDSANLPEPTPGPTNWMDWELRKTLKLLRFAP